jgi:diacylglycerol O-acyltransferase / wax synthase
MATRRRDKMSAVDTAWLRMDRPDNLMVICGVMTLRERTTAARLAATIDKRFLRYARFGKRPVEEAGVAYWETDPAFDLARHLIEVRLPGRGGTRQLQALVSRLVSTPLDPAHPLWQFHLVDNFRGGCALVMRIHHCYADGIALTQVLLAMTDPTRRRAAAARLPQTTHASDGAAGLARLKGTLPDVMQLALKVGAAMIGKGVAIWQDPAAALDLATQGTAFAADIAKLALMAQDSPTPFKGKPGVAKCAAWAEPVALADVKAVGRALGASVNDVTTACAVGALRSYLVAKGAPVRGVVIRALVPVNLRPLAKARELGNQFGLVFLDLPVGIQSPVRRVAAVRANMNALKVSFQPVLSLGLLAAMGSGPKVLQDQLLLALSRNATAVMTNVPGPQQPLYLAGAEVGSMMVWVPQSGDIGMGVSILTYNGQVQFSLLTDRKLCPDPGDISARFAPEFAKLRAAALRKRRARAPGPAATSGQGQR